MWIARDKDGSLFLYDRPPLKADFNDCWAISEGKMYQLPPTVFPEVKWENGPRELLVK